MKQEMRSLVAQLKNANQDFEFYPTTDEIIELIANDIAHHNLWSYYGHGDKNEYSSFLDCGAGDGRTLAKFYEKLCEKRDSVSGYENAPSAWFAIEKAQPLIARLPDFVSFAGADFYETDLTHQQHGIIFSNPPYSEFEFWTEHLIRTANCYQLYLVIPKRWENSMAIKQAIAYRRAEVTNLGEFDFENADRAARAKVDVLRIDLFECRELNYRRCDSIPEYNYTINSAFDELFATEFNNLMNLDDVVAEKEKAKSVRHLNFDLEVLVMDYAADLQEIQDNYRAVSQLSPSIFKELEINLESIKNSLKNRLSTLRNEYWGKVFKAYEPLSSRFTSDSLNKFRNTITKGKTLDFNLRNIYAITEMAIKNANMIYDQQLADFWFELANDDYVKAYKSNEKVFDKWSFRYNKRDSKGYALDYRIIYYAGTGWNGLVERGEIAWGHDKIFRDLYVIARCLGYTVTENHHSYYLEAKSKYEIKAHKNGKSVVLADFKLYNNGNVHFRFNKKFMLALNVEVGRILGWVTSTSHAAEEMEVDEKDVVAVYGSSFSIKEGSVALLGLDTDEAENDGFQIEMEVV